MGTPYGPKGELRDRHQCISDGEELRVCGTWSCCALMLDAPLPSYYGLLRGLPTYELGTGSRPVFFLLPIHWPRLSILESWEIRLAQLITVTAGKTCCRLATPWPVDLICLRVYINCLIPP